MKRATSIAQILATALGSIGVGVLAEATGGAGHQAPRSAPDQPASGTKIRMKVGDRVVTATLIDNATSRDLVSMLPLTVTLEDHAATEKIGYLPRKLSTEGAPAGSDPALGDVAYYAPWGNLALYYKDFHHSSGLIILGRIDSGLEALSVPGTVRAAIERLEP